jgi:GNAT superfamily N-acetyltransferase
VIEPARADTAPGLSGALAPAGLRLRPQTGDDASFLEALYVSVRLPELVPSGWPDEAKRAFLIDQFRLQTRHYAHAYYDAKFSIVEHGGRAVGRLYLFRGRADHRIVDISLVPDSRGKGFGSALLKAVMEEAAAARKTVSIHVEQFNPARNLYRRLGFVELRAEGPYLLMEWPNGR